MGPDEAVAMLSSADELIAVHRAARRSFEAGGVRSFVRTGGVGAPVVLLHGLPSSWFLYRKVIDELAGRGFAALSFDLPGLGLADRPADADHTIAGLGRFAAAGVSAGPSFPHGPHHRPRASRSASFVETMGYWHHPIRVAIGQ